MQIQGVQCSMVLVVNFFVFWKVLLFCFVVNICDLVHDVEAILSFPELLTVSGNLL